MNFRTNDTFIDLLSFKEAEATRKGIPNELPTSGEITGIEVRLSKVLIKDNGTAPIWPFPGFASMYLMLIVVSDKSTEPVSVELKGFAKVADNEELPIDKTLFYWKKKEGETETPGQVHVFAAVIKSKEGMRDTATLMSEVQNDNDYKKLATTITGLLRKGTPAGAVTDSIFSMASIAGKYLRRVKDKPWFTWLQSFTDINGDFDTLGQTVRGRENEKVAMAFNIIIRDRSRELSVIASLPEHQKELLKSYIE